MSDRPAPAGNKAIEFFTDQFDRQIDAAEYRLNAFEERALAYLEGDVLDLGWGLGNLAIAAAERGHPVLALDACNRAVEDLRRRAASRSLPLESGWADLSDWKAEGTYDSVVSLGLLMFLDCAVASRVNGHYMGKPRISSARARGGGSWTSSSIDSSKRRARLRWWR